MSCVIDMVEIADAVSEAGSYLDLGPDVATRVQKYRSLDAVKAVVSAINVLQRNVEAFAMLDRKPGFLLAVA